MTRKRGRWLAVAMSGLVVAIGLLACTRSSSGPTLEAERPPAAYHVVYMVQTPGGPLQREDLLVRRPYWSKDVLRVGDRIVGGSLTKTDGFYEYLSLSSGTGWQLQEGGQQRATHDFRVVPPLVWGQARGLSQVLRRDRVAGRPCVVVRSGAPLGSPIMRPSSVEHTDFCVDGSGIVLREVWVRHGHAILRRQAVSLDLAPRLESEEFDAVPALAALPPGEAGSAFVVPTKPGQLPDRGAAPEPDGFTIDGTYTEVRPQLQGGVLTSAETTSVELYRHSIDLIVVRRGVIDENFTLQGVAVQVGPFAGYLQLGYDESTLTIQLDRDHYVSLEAVDPPTLLGAGRALVVRSSAPTVPPVHTTVARVP